jgi:hypothetical protein
MCEKHQGYANYATFRVIVEFSNDYGHYTNMMELATEHEEDTDLADALKAYVTDCIDVDGDDTLAAQYAHAFIDDVDWMKFATDARDYDA